MHDPSVDARCLLGDFGRLAEDSGAGDSRSSDVIESVNVHSRQGTHNHNVQKCGVLLIKMSQIHSKMKYPMRKQLETGLFYGWPNEVPRK